MDRRAFVGVWVAALMCAAHATVGEVEVFSRQLDEYCASFTSQVNTVKLFDSGNVYCQALRRRKQVSLPDDLPVDVGKVCASISSNGDAIEFKFEVGPYPYMFVKAEVGVIVGKVGIPEDVDEAYPVRIAGLEEKNVTMSVALQDFGANRNCCATDLTLLMRAQLQPSSGPKVAGLFVYPRVSAKKKCGRVPGTKPRYCEVSLICEDCVREQPPVDPTVCTTVECPLSLVEGEVAIDECAVIEKEVGSACNLGGVSGTFQRISTSNFCRCDTDLSSCSLDCNSGEGSCTTQSKVLGNCQSSSGNSGVSVYTGFDNTCTCFNPSRLDCGSAGNIVDNCQDGDFFGNLVAQDGGCTCVTPCNLLVDRSDPYSSTPSYAGASCEAVVEGVEGVVPGIVSERDIQGVRTCVCEPLVKTDDTCEVQICSFTDVIHGSECETQRLAKFSECSSLGYTGRAFPTDDDDKCTCVVPRDMLEGCLEGIVGDSCEVDGSIGMISRRCTCSLPCVEVDGNLSYTGSNCRIIESGLSGTYGRDVAGTCVCANQQLDCNDSQCELGGRCVDVGSPCTTPELAGLETSLVRGKSDTCVCATEQTCNFNLTLRSRTGSSRAERVATPGLPCKFGYKAGHFVVTGEGVCGCEVECVTELDCHGEACATGLGILGETCANGAGTFILGYGNRCQCVTDPILGANPPYTCSSQYIRNINSFAGSFGGSGFGNVGEECSLIDGSPGTYTDDCVCVPFSNIEDPRACINFETIDVSFTNKVFVGQECGVTNSPLEVGLFVRVEENICACRREP
eukprot:CAMPEP_0184748578 /NCGR_PEP_ID=MMETSP0315-20130426/20669_1 /TAXON_ID=101924 /ORGANISM="Rhodosorus marinus, Strain UTEX LB 2760" /LENGTH=792 /DNA_ID=CAMNT_0027224067 /DNA_START=166 /DNA_END=2541 /DNA_ORIENTATION=-